MKHGSESSPFSLTALGIKYFTSNENMFYFINNYDYLSILTLKNKTKKKVFTVGDNPGFATNFKDRLKTSQ